MEEKSMNFSGFSDEHLDQIVGGVVRKFASEAKEEEEEERKRE